VKKQPSQHSQIALYSLVGLLVVLASSFLYFGMSDSPTGDVPVTGYVALGQSCSSLVKPCDSGLVCDSFTKLCVSGTTPSCAKDKDCPGGQKCDLIRGQCKTTTISPPTGKSNPSPIPGDSTATSETSDLDAAVKDKSFENNVRKTKRSSAGHYISEIPGLAGVLNDIYARLRLLSSTSSTPKTVPHAQSADTATSALSAGHCTVVGYGLRKPQGGELGNTYGKKVCDSGQQLLTFSNEYTDSKQPYTGSVNTDGTPRNFVQWPEDGKWYDNYYTYSCCTSFTRSPLQIKRAELYQQGVSLDWVLTIEANNALSSCFLKGPLGSDVNARDGDTRKLFPFNFQRQVASAGRIVQQAGYVSYPGIFIEEGDEEFGGALGIQTDAPLHPDIKLRCFDTAGSVADVTATYAPGTEWTR